MSAPLHTTPHRQAPIDLRDVIKRAADLLERASSTIYGPNPRTDFLGCVAELRALLPVADQPECPNCHHKDNRHDEHGCQDVKGDPATTFDVTCDCPFPAAALDAARALVGAERDSKPAKRKPRVWLEGDPDPRILGVTTLSDSQKTPWYAQGGGWSAAHPNRSGEPDYAWSEMNSNWFPFTEVLDGGES